VTNRPGYVDRTNAERQRRFRRKQISDMERLLREKQVLLNEREVLLKKLDSLQRKLKRNRTNGE